MRPGLCRCKPGFFGADCSSRECFAPLLAACPGCWGLPRHLLIVISFLPQPALHSTGVTTASSAVCATPVGRARQRAGAAPATPSAGESCASSAAPAAPTAVVTPRLEPAAVSRAGGVLTARSSASATSPPRAATPSPGTAIAGWAGGEGSADSSAPATSHPAPRRRAIANARLVFGGRRVSGTATVCVVPATLSMGIAAVSQVSRAGAARTPAQRGLMGPSACTGELVTAGTRGGGRCGCIHPFGCAGRCIWRWRLRAVSGCSIGVAPKKHPANAKGGLWHHPKILVPSLEQ